MNILKKKLIWMLPLMLMVLYGLTTPQNHSEAEDVYDFALKVEQGGFAEQAGVNRVLALPTYGVAYKAAQALGYSGRAFPFMIFINRILAVLSVLLFWKIITGVGRQALGVGSQNAGGRGNSPPNTCCLIPIVLLFAFSYGFWRYANEAETYILASVLVLGAWCLAVKSVVGCSLTVDRSAVSSHDAYSIFRISHAAKRRLAYIICTLLSSVGILVHLLNLIPLLLIIPLYYLLSGKWKNAIIHGVATGVLVLAGYVICAPWIDFSELGANHHALEGGLGLKNLARGGIAFGQCLVAGNFLFGFDSFQNLLANLFPSRMLDEEFFMGRHMPGWIKWAGLVTFGAVTVCSLCFVVQALLRRKTALECGDSAPLLDTNALRSPSAFLCALRGKIKSFHPLTCSALVWFILYAIAVIHTEAGSPELWILGLIPFWLIVASLSQGAWGRELVPASNRSSRLLFWGGACVLFAHNLVAGLLPLMAKDGDYHAAKGEWLVEHTMPSDLILTDYEPVMIFYLRYHTRASVLNSGELNVEEINHKLDSLDGHAYACNSFFQPMDAMRMRYPELHARMKTNGQSLRPQFRKCFEDEFGGVYLWMGKRDAE